MPDIKINENSYRNLEVHRIIAKLLRDYFVLLDSQWQKAEGKWVHKKGTSTEWPKTFQGIPIFKPYPVYGYLELNHFDVTGMNDVHIFRALFIADDRSPIVQSERPPTIGYNFGGKYNFTVDFPPQLELPPAHMSREGGTYERELAKLNPTDDWKPALKVWKFKLEGAEDRPFSVCLVVPWKYEPAAGAAAAAAGGGKKKEPVAPEITQWINDLAEQTLGSVLQRLEEDGRAEAAAGALFRTGSRRRLRVVIRRVWRDGARARTDRSDDVGGGDDSGGGSGGAGHDGDGKSGSGGRGGGGGGEGGGGGGGGSPSAGGGGGFGAEGGPMGGSGGDHGSEPRRKRRQSAQGGGRAHGRAPGAACCRRRSAAHGART